MIALATRGSALARIQAALAISELRSRFPDEEFRAVVVDSDGDLSPSTLAPDQPGEGWFTSRLERALQRGQVDGAIHSAKDLPTESASGLYLPAFLPRSDPRDSLVLRVGRGIAVLPQGARLGTSSPRRGAQLRALRPDLRIEPIRGNVDTRLSKVYGGLLDGCVVAQAGLLRIGRANEGAPLDPQSECTPAPAQGAIAIQARPGSHFAELAMAVDDPTTRACVEAERRVLTLMGGGCRLPLGALAEHLGGDQVRLTVAWAAAEGEGVRRISELARPGELPSLAAAIAARFL